MTEWIGVGSDLNLDRDSRLLHCRRRVARTLLMLAFLFAVCWMPYNFLNLIIDHFDKDIQEKINIKVLSWSINSNLVFVSDGTCNTLKLTAENHNLNRLFWTLMLLITRVRNNLFCWTKWWKKRKSIVHPCANDPIRVDIKELHQHRLTMSIKSTCKPSHKSWILLHCLNTKMIDFNWLKKFNFNQARDTFLRSVNS